MTNDTSPALPNPVGGPFLIVATFCERVLSEKDSVDTLVRIVDRYWFGPVPPAVLAGSPDLRPGIDTYLYVNVKSGDFVGTTQLSVSIHRPSGALVGPPTIASLNLKGAEHGVSATIRVGVPIFETGVHWAVVRIDERVVTCVPLRIEPLSTAGAAESQPVDPSPKPTA